jgi:hypothetical protein
MVRLACRALSSRLHFAVEVHHAIAPARRDVFGAGSAVEVPRTLWRPLPMTPIACVDVMRRRLAPAIRGVVSETSALRGNSVEIASAAVTGVALGMQGSSARVPTAATRPGTCRQAKAGRNSDVSLMTWSSAASSMACNGADALPPRTGRGQPAGRVQPGRPAERPVLHQPWSESHA